MSHRKLQTADTKNNNTAIIVAVIGLIGVFITAYFGFRSTTKPYELAVSLTQTSDAQAHTATVTPVQIVGTNTIALTVEEIENIGWSYYRKEEYEEAIKYFSQTIQMDSKYANGYYGLGYCYYKIRRYDAALKKFNEAIALDTSNADAYYGRGLTYFGMEEYRLAIPDFTVTLSMEPTWWETFTFRGWAYYQIKEYDLAIQDFNKALELNPNYEWANDGLQKSVEAKGQ